jgi:hypothetical protein
MASGSGSTASGAYSFVHGIGSTASGTTTIVLGNNITGTELNTVYVPTLVLTTVRDYVSHVAAVADATLPSGGVYTVTTTGGALFRKP